MRVFILCTGRCGSASLIEACRYIDNFSAGHESLTEERGEERWTYPDQHIEADNRLAWHLGELDAHFDNDPYFVHLKRDPEATAKSYSKRFFESKGIMDAFVGGIRKTPPEILNRTERLNFCADYVTTVNANIAHFLRDKSKVMPIRLENLEEDFKRFWREIDAEGDLEKALECLKTKHNTSAKRDYPWLYELKLFVFKCGKKWNKIIKSGSP